METNLDFRVTGC